MWTFDLEKGFAEFIISRAKFKRAMRLGHIILPSYIWLGVKCLAEFVPERVYDITVEGATVLLVEQTTREHIVIEDRPPDILSNNA